MKEYFYCKSGRDRSEAGERTHQHKINNETKKTMQHNNAKQVKEFQGGGYNSLTRRSVSLKGECLTKALAFVRDAPLGEGGGGKTN